MIQPVESLLNRVSPRWLLGSVLGLALLLRLALIAALGDVSHTANIWEYGEQALCAVRTHGDLCLNYPGGGGTYPSAYMPPLLSYYWLALFQLLGDGPAARAVWLGSSLAAGLASVWLVFRLTMELGRSHWAAALAAALLAAYPTFVFVSATYHQTNWAVFFILAVTYLAVRCAKAGKVRLIDAFAGGVLCGLATLNRSEMLLIGPALIALGTAWRLNFGDLVRTGVVAGLAMVVTLAPWTVRNYQLFDRLIPVAQSSGYNLWKGFNPYTNGSGNMTEAPGGPGDEARTRIRDTVPPGPQYETRLQDAYALELEAYLDQASFGRLAELTVNKAMLLWVFDWTDADITGRPAYLAPWAASNLLALLGLAVMWRDRSRIDPATLWICLAALTLLTAAYAATAVHARYRMHIEPFLFVAAGVGAEALLVRLGAGMGWRPNAARASPDP